MTHSKFAAAIALCVGLVAGRAPAGEPTDAERTKIANQLAAAMKAQDANAYGALWDGQAVVDRTIANVEAPKDIRSGFIEGLGAASIGTKLAQNLIKSIGSTGSYTFLHLRHADGETRPLFRLNGDSGLNYHEYVIKNDASGTPRVVDIYIYSSSETLVQIQRRLYMQLAFGQQGKKVPPQIETLLNVQKAMAAEDWKTVLAAYNAAPPEAKKERCLHVFRLIAASRSGDDNAYKQALLDFTTRFPGEAAADMMSIDTYFMNRQFKEELAAVSRIEKQVGPDPFLNVLRANVAIAEGDIAAGKKLAAAALEKEPSLFEAADILLTQALAEKDYPASKRYLLQIERNRETFRFNDLKGSEAFKGFVASPEYAAWQAERPKNAPPVTAQPAN